MKPKIYVSHSTAFDYEKQLYQPLRSSVLNANYEFFLPHEQTVIPTHTRKILEQCDLLIAEVSYPSTGQGIELGWAEGLQVPIFCFYQLGKKHSSSLSLIAKKIMGYQSADDLIKKLAETLIAF